MTVDDVLKELCLLCGMSKIVKGHLNALVRGERERCAAVLTKVVENLDSRVRPEQYAQTVLQNCLREILRSSSGEGGG